VVAISLSLCQTALFFSVILMSSSHDEAEQPLLSGRQADYSGHIAAPAGDKRDYRAVARIVGCCISAASNGWHDGCIGALIPYLQHYYAGVTDEKVSLVFIGSFTGYILASLLNVTLSIRLGLGRLLIFGAVVQGLASAVIVLRPPFNAIPFCYAAIGFGLALQDAQWNTYVARLPNAATNLGFAHAIYGLGALSSPVVATLLMQAKVQPPHFYATNVVWCVTTIIVLSAGFGLSGSSLSNVESQSLIENDEEIAPLRMVISSRAVWTAFLFISLYTGAETTEAGWIVSFMMRERKGGALSGYASAAFYCGLTSSRVLLLPLTAFLTEKIAVDLYAAIAFAMQIIVWVVPTFLFDLIAVAACGFVMGPMYPITVSLVTKATPHGYHPGALSLMSCFGQSGSALFPFVVGSFANAYDIKVLPPVLIALFIAMTLLWQLVPAAKVSLPRSTPGS
jgi:fucose permease